MLSVVKYGFVVSASGCIQPFAEFGARFVYFSNHQLKLPRRAKVSYQVALMNVPGFENYGLIEDSTAVNVQWDGSSMEPIETAPFIYNSEVPA